MEDDIVSTSDKQVDANHSVPHHVDNFNTTVCIVIYFIYKPNELGFTVIINTDGGTVLSTTLSTTSRACTSASPRVYLNLSYPQAPGRVERSGCCRADYAPSV
ncbi:hypothetical protein FHX52_0778 [Humibacillus xanthopallidus]|uniref:Uncharacterized protein n=1 Tax=Humibacillus xanthopallidus TaxID=412689 RepID=A0A543PUC1_9MICO|nr:hypothetical protein [Humibacillus xanthopallidus]TQN47671.1 hypothetical protein FHX52_0778 [Humibacillus xanthopallidus]